MKKFGNWTSGCTDELVTGNVSQECSNPDEKPCHKYSLLDRKYCFVTPLPCWWQKKPYQLCSQGYTTGGHIYTVKLLVNVALSKHKRFRIKVLLFVNILLTSHRGKSGLRKLFNSFSSYSRSLLIWASRRLEKDSGKKCRKTDSYPR